METNTYLPNVIQRLTSNGANLKQDVNYKGFLFTYIAHSMNRSVLSIYEDRFTFFSKFNNITSDDLQLYTKSCLSYSKRHKFLPYIPLFTVFLFPVAIVNQIDSITIDNLHQYRSQFRFGYIDMPIVYNITSNEIHYPQEDNIGGAPYFHHCREIIKEVLSP